MGKQTDKPKATSPFNFFKVRAYKILSCVTVIGALRVNKACQFTKISYSKTLKF